MKSLLLLLVLCVVGWVLWTQVLPSSDVWQRGTPEKPSPLPAPRVVQDSLGTLVVGSEVLTGVVVHSVYPDGLSITHSDGARKVPVEDLSETLRRQYALDADAALRYRQLVDAHLAYKRYLEKSPPPPVARATSQPGPAVPDGQAEVALEPAITPQSSWHEDLLGSVLSIVQPKASPATAAPPPQD